MSTVSDSWSYLPIKFTLTLLPFAGCLSNFMSICLSVAIILFSTIVQCIRGRNIIIINTSYISVLTHSHK